MTFMMITNGAGEVGAVEIPMAEDDLDVWEALYRLDPEMYGMIGDHDVLDIFEDLVGSIVIDNAEELGEFLGRTGEEERRWS